MNKRKNISQCNGPCRGAIEWLQQIHRQGGGDAIPKSALEPMVKSKPTSSSFVRKLSVLELSL